jgi:hypothetical protein
MNEKYAILKPDKGSGVVLLKNEDYMNGMTELFADPYKFRKLDKNDTLTQLTTLQSYLRKIHKEAKSTMTNTTLYDHNQLNQHEHMVFLKRINLMTIYHH